MLKVNNVFESISGEAGGFLQGSWMTGVRLQGCNLRCAYCDTPQGQDGNGLCYEMGVSQVLSMVRKIGNERVLITGGEPLLQEETVELIGELLRDGRVVQVETNGSLPLPLPLPLLTASSTDWMPLHWVVDRKGPSSKMQGKMIPLKALAKEINQVERDDGAVYLKWVVSGDEDVDFMAQEIRELIDLGVVDVPFIASPIDAQGDRINAIVERLRDRDEQALLSQIIFSIQLHKIFKMP